MLSTVNICAIVLITFSAIAIATPIPEFGTNEMTVVGTIEGKTYFIEKTSMSWAAARQRCNQVGMQLATITTFSQLSFLGANYPITGMSTYWTAGRDALSPAQFVWDTNKEPLSDNLFTTFYYFPMQTCVAYRSLVIYRNELYSVPCETPRYFMCELVHG